MENEDLEQIPQKNNKNKIISIILNIVLIIGILLLIARICILSLLTNVYVTGPSMYPSLKEGDAGYTRKVFDYEDIDRFDIIVIKADRFASQDSHWIKRVIALPGETISYELDKENLTGILKINGQIIAEDFINGYDDATSDMIKYFTGTIQERKLGDNEYFVMGDNRGRSTDSRSAAVGVIYKDEIYGLGIVVVGECKDLSTDTTCKSVKRTGIKVVGW